MSDASENIVRLNDYDPNEPQEWKFKCGSRLVIYPGDGPLTIAQAVLILNSVLFQMMSMFHSQKEI